MRVKMEYHIISGKVVETRRCWMAERNTMSKVRGQKKAGNTSMGKIRLNERESIRKLARILNTNFGEGFIFVTLKYGNGRLPADYEEARKNAAAFLRKARAEHAKEHPGETLRYVCVTANWSPKRGSKARLHHHIVMDPASMDMLERIWPQGEFHVKVVHNPSDLSRLAAYLCENTRDLQPGQKQWSTSRGMDKPVYTEPKPVEFVEAINPLPDTTIVDAEQTIGEDGLVVGSYLRCICHSPVKVRGGMVILPRKRKKDKMPDTLEVAIWQEADE